MCSKPGLRQMPPTVREEVTPVAVRAPRRANLDVHALFTLSRARLAEMRRLPRQTDSAAPKIAASPIDSMPPCHGG